MIKEVDPEHPTVIVTAERRSERGASAAHPLDRYLGHQLVQRRVLARRAPDRPGLDRALHRDQVRRAAAGRSPRPSGARLLRPTAQGVKAIAADVEHHRHALPRQLRLPLGQQQDAARHVVRAAHPHGRANRTRARAARVWGGRHPKRDTARRAGASRARLRVPAGAPLEASLSASDSETLRHRVVHEDTLDQGSASTPALCERVGPTGLLCAAPSGPYRVLGVARDPSGAAALAGGRFFVEGDAELDATLPFRVDDHFVYSGWMGDAAEGGLTAKTAICLSTTARTAATRSRTRAAHRAGLVWRGTPRANWDGSEQGVRIPTGAVAVEFLAWGEDGGERVSFYAGNADAGESSGALENQRLRQEPRRFRIELAAGESEDITSAFSWVAGANGEMTFYIRDIRWVAEALLYARLGWSTGASTSAGATAAARVDSQRLKAVGGSTRGSRSRRADPRPPPSSQSENRTRPSAMSRRRGARRPRRTSTRRPPPHAAARSRRRTRRPASRLPARGARGMSIAP